MRIEPFTPDHLERLLLQPSQTMMQPLLTDRSYGENLFRGGPAYAGVVDDQVIACMGLIPQWEHRAHAWGLIAKEAGPYFVQITKAVMRTMEMHPYRRIETAVLSHFSQGHRWAELLGFKREGTMRAYTPTGDDCDLYARVSCKH